MCDSFRLRPLTVRHSGRSRFRGREHIQRLMRSWRMEEGSQIDQEVRREFERTGDMVDGLLRIIAHNERVRCQLVWSSSSTVPL